MQSGRILLSERCTVMNRDGTHLRSIATAIVK
jgi:hypothetical protein